MREVFYEKQNVDFDLQVQQRWVCGKQRKIWVTGENLK